MSELLNEKELGPDELTLLARAILLELEGPGGSGDLNYDSGAAYASYAPDNAQGVAGRAAEYGAERAFEALGTAVGSAVFRSLEKRLLTNIAQAAKVPEGSERRSEERAGVDGENGGDESSFLKAGGGNEASWGRSAGADEEERERNGMAGGLGLDGSGLPERLSEIFCRDARRYDGPFDRY